MILYFLYILRQAQHGPNRGRCGVCGEEYSKTDKLLEPGPANKYATGLITARYTPGQISMCYNKAIPYQSVSTHHSWLRSGIRI